jgi:CRP-like cAMP-binding protein
MIKPTQSAGLIDTDIFRGLSGEELKQITSTGRRVEIKRHAYLFHQGEPADIFYVLLEGTARLSQLTPDGKQVIIHFFGSGDAIGLIVVLAGTTYPLSAKAITPCIAVGWDRACFARHMERCPELAVNAAQIVAARFGELQKRYSELSTQCVERRLAHAVLRLAEWQSGRNGEESAPTLAISRQDLAEMTGTTLYTVSRICSQWEQQGLLATGRERIRLLQPDELAAIAEDGEGGA